MTKRNLTRYFFLTITILAGLPCFFDGAFSSVFRLHIQNNKISVNADNVPLQIILERLVDLGIFVYIDPGINPAISASFENRELDDGLKSILKSLNYVVVWEPVAEHPKTSLSKNFKITEIQIFQEGKKERMVALKQAERKESVPEKPETRVIIEGNKVFVPVILGYGDREVKTMLIFDTGADSVVVHEHIADTLDITEYVGSRAIGVGGIEISTKKATLDYVVVGPHRKTGLAAHIVDYQGPPIENYNGILGMNFLKGLKYFIDFDKQIIKWQ